MCIAIAGNTSSSAAVLQSLLALSSLHRDGVQQQAAIFKVSSLKALAAASNESRDKLGCKEILQHVAAGMLLCSFEVISPLNSFDVEANYYSIGSAVILHVEPLDVVHCWC